MYLSVPEAEHQQLMIHDYINDNKNHLQDKINQNNTINVQLLK